MEKYKCEICNKKHSVYYSSTGGIPKSILDIRMKEELNRIEELSEYLHVVDKKDVYLKGNVTMETIFTEDPITHEAWIEIPIKEYVSQIEEAKGKSDLSINGKIASILPFHQNVIGLNAKWILDSENQLGEIIAVSNSKLKEDQQKPITKERIQKMMELVHHPELHKEKKIFSNSFKQRLKKVIQQAKTEFKSKNKTFLIDISNIKEVLFQLIPSEMTEIEPKKDIGLHLSNDKPNENYDYVKTKMAQMVSKHQFNKITLDEIETYQKNYGFDDASVFTEIKQILESIFEENLEEIDVEINEM